MCLDFRVLVLFSFGLSIYWPFLYACLALRMDSICFFLSFGSRYDGAYLVGIDIGYRFISYWLDEKNLIKLNETDSIYLSYAVIVYNAIKTDYVT